MNSINWVQDLKENISITPKDLTTQPLDITKAQTLGLFRIGCNSNSSYSTNRGSCGMA